MCAFYSPGWFDLWFDACIQRLDDVEEKEREREAGAKLGSGLYTLTILDPKYL